MNTIFDRYIEPSTIVRLQFKLLYYRNLEEEEEEEEEEGRRQRHSSGENDVINDDEEDCTSLLRKEVELLPEDIGVVCQQPADSVECLLLPYSSDDNGTENFQPGEYVLHGNGTFPLATDSAENGVVPNGPFPGLGGDEKKKEENKKRKRNADLSSEAPQRKRNRLKETYFGSSKRFCGYCKFPHYKCNCEENTADQEEDSTPHRTSSREELFASAVNTLSDDMQRQFRSLSKTTQLKLFLDFCGKRNAPVVPGIPPASLPAALAQHSPHEDGEVCLICRDPCTPALPYGTPKCKECKPSKIHLECWKRYISQGMERQLKCLTCNKGTIARSLRRSFEESNL